MVGPGAGRPTYLSCFECNQPRKSVNDPCRRAPGADGPPRRRRGGRGRASGHSSAKIASTRHFGLAGPAGALAGGSRAPVAVRAARRARPQAARLPPSRRSSIFPTFCFARGGAVPALRDGERQRRERQRAARERASLPRLQGPVVQLDGELERASKRSPPATRRTRRPSSSAIRRRWPGSCPRT